MSENDNKAEGPVSPSTEEQLKRIRELKFAIRDNIEHLRKPAQERWGMHDGVYACDEEGNDFDEDDFEELWEEGCKGCPCHFQDEWHADYWSARLRQIDEEHDKGEIFPLSKRIEGLERRLLYLLCYLMKNRRDFMPLEDSDDWCDCACRSDYAEQKRAEREAKRYLNKRLEVLWDGEVTYSDIESD